MRPRTTRAWGEQATGTQHEGLGSGGVGHHSGRSKLWVKQILVCVTSKVYMSSSEMEVISTAYQKI